MSATPNYGINLTICGVSDIDRELKRVEDKVNLNTAASANRYTKDEVDRMLGGKADRCAFEKHVVECDRGRPGRKPPHDCKPACDCDYYTKGEIDELLSNILCSCDFYSKSEIDNFLSNKVDLSPVEEHQIRFTEPLKQICRSVYSKDPFGTVIVNLSCVSENGALENGQTITVLPEKFRPKATLEVNGSINVGTTKDSCTFHITNTGEIKFVRVSTSAANKCFLSASFIAAK